MASKTLQGAGEGGIARSAIRDSINRLLGSLPTYLLVDRGALADESPLVPYLVAEYLRISLRENEDCWRVRPVAGAEAASGSFACEYGHEKGVPYHLQETGVRGPGSAQTSVTQAPPELRITREARGGNP